MKKLFLFILPLTLVLLVSQLRAQTYGFEMRLENFEQISEYEFQFEVSIRKQPTTTDMAIEAFQFQVEYNPYILNGGSFINANLTFDNSISDLVGNVKNGVFTSITGNRLQYASNGAGPSGSPVTVLTTTWLKIGRFKVKLANGSGFLNFKSAKPEFRFRTDPSVVYTALVRCNYTGTAPNFFKSGTSIFAVTNRTLYPAAGVPMAVRQLAGFWFYGTGNASDPTKWNTVLKTANPLYIQTVPAGPHANIVINGHCTYPTALKESYYPDSNGNGGELTILEGPVPVYNLTIEANGNFRIWVDVWNNGLYIGSPIASAQGAINPVVTISVTAGTNLWIESYRTHPTGGTFINWTGSGASLINPLNENLQMFTMPSYNVYFKANWTSGTKSVEITGLEEPSNEKGKSLYASLTLKPGSGLSVDKVYNLNPNGSAALVLESDATGSGYLILNNPDVPAKVQRYLSQDKYHYVSTPIEAAPYSLFQVTPAPTPPEFADFYYWEETTREWINLNYPYSNPPVGNLQLGRGYAVAYSDADHTKVFDGELNVGNITINCTYTPGATPPYWNQRGYNLIGNPYASAIDADALLLAHPNMTSLYFWDEAPNYLGNRNDYATYTLGGGVGTSPAVGGANPNNPDGFIAPHQGFFAKLVSTPHNMPATIPVTFTNNMRVLDDAYFYKDNSNKDRIWLSVTGPEGDYNAILVTLMDGAEVGFDRTDAEKIKGNEKLALYTILEGQDFIIQCLPKLGPTDSYEIPIGLDAGFAGLYKFEVQKIENFDPSVTLYLQDKLTNQFINLRSKGQYTVNISDPGAIRNRFVLHINGATSVPEIGQVTAKVYAIRHQIVIEHPQYTILDVEVVNTIGQTITQVPVNASEVVLNIPGGKGVYIVRVRTSEGIESHKVLIR